MQPCETKTPLAIADTIRAQSSDVLVNGKQPAERLILIVKYFKKFALSAKTIGFFQTSNEEKNECIQV